MCLKTRTRLYFQEITFGISRIILFQNWAIIKNQNKKTKQKKKQKQRQKNKKKKKKNTKNEKNFNLKMPLVVPNQVIIVNTSAIIIPGHLGESG